MGCEAFHAEAATDGSLPLALSQRHAPEGVPQADAGWSAPRHRQLPPNIAPQPSGNPLAEILFDFRTLRAEWRAMRVRRALGREFREVERQVLAEHDAPDS